MAPASSSMCFELNDRECAPAAERVSTSKPGIHASRVHRLNAGPFRVDVVPDGQEHLYRVAWPDIGLSDAANLSRCCDAARQWMEHQVMTERGKMSAARRLKSLNNFSWRRSPVLSTCSRQGRTPWAT